jgi:hypothetical protein
MLSSTISTQLLFSCGGLGAAMSIKLVYATWPIINGGVCITSKPGWRIVLETQILSSWSVVGSLLYLATEEYCNLQGRGFIIFCVALAH